MRTTPAVSCLTLAAMLLTCGCEEGLPERAGVVVRDSSGVSILEVPGRDLEGLPTWDVASEPMVSIGAVEGEAPYLFGRISDAALLETGEIVVLDHMTQDVRVFTPEGEFVRSFGGFGSGPSEFQVATELWPQTGSRFAIYDWRLSKIVTFDVQAGVESVASLRDPQCPPLAIPSECVVMGILSDGSIVTANTAQVQSLGPMASNEARTYPPRLRRLGVWNGAEVLGLDAFRSVGATHLEHDDGWIWFVPTAFATSTEFTIGGSRVLIAANDTYELRYWSLGGSLDRIVRVDRQPVSLSEEQLAPFRRWAASEEAEARVGYYLDRVSLPSEVPQFGAMRLDAEGRTWLADYAPDEEFFPTEEISWTVLSREGVPIGRVTTGPPWNVMDIGSTSLLVLQEDDLGVQRVAVFEFHPGPPKRG